MAHGKIMTGPITAHGERIKEILHAALEMKSPAERDRYLNEVCREDAALRQQVESLLQAHERAGDFLSEPGKTNGVGTEKSGSSIGRYKLLELIGEGGFGTVWMAEQEEPVRRRVALKVIKPGMDTKQVLARFEAERQALAMMDHPSIARVFDGGATETGRPYFVMELVRGVRITDYCDSNKLSPRERISLFIQVCHAVQHAHQKGVIHRDLKPSNILITEMDGAPIPKVIDFGVAKAMQTRLTELTLFTRLHEMIGTPSYMSPEQAGLGALDMDTRSDIYSLGVLLYELLTGQTPLSKDDLENAGPDEVFRMVREGEAPKPSTRLSSLTGEQLTTVAAQRQTEPVRLNRLLTGDLDWIVMKALEKDRRRRYETASALAADLLHYLSNEPVTARSPTSLYRLQKAWRRHKTVFTAVVITALALILATAVSVRQAIRATHAEGLAKKRLAESEAISKSLAEMAQHSYTVGALNNNEPVFVFDDAGRNAAIDLAERVLAFNRDVHGLESMEAIEATENLSDAYAAGHRNDEAIKQREQALALRQKLNPSATSDLIGGMEALSVLYIISDRSQDATAVLAKASALSPTNTMIALRLAVWQAWFAQDKAFETTRRRLIELAEETDAAKVGEREKAVRAERAAKVYCLRPASNAEEITKVLAMAKRTIGVTNRTGLPWFELAVGLAEYRNGDYAAAEQILTIAEQGMAGKRGEAQYTARLFRSMCLFQQGRAEEARQVFSEAEARMPKLPKDESTPAFAQRFLNQELLICGMAYKEAKALLKP
jgi:serine/threonine protein kinase